jgi:hypothetical protein
MMHGYGMGQGMMGGCGMGPGMMYGCGPCMMHGWGGMKPGMMHNWGSMGKMPGWGMPQSGGKMSEDQRNFFEQTREERKKLHDLRFQYGEALRNPETDSKTVTELEKQMAELQQQIMEKAHR